MIDFDYASEEWRKNKIPLSNGMFKYKKVQCKFIKKNFERCKLYLNNTHQFNNLAKFCHIHNKKSK
jgi:hypothetical protein